MKAQISVQTTGGEWYVGDSVETEASLEVVDNALEEVCGSKNGYVSLFQENDSVKRVFPLASILQVKREVIE